MSVLDEEAVLAAPPQPLEVRRQMNLLMQDELLRHSRRSMTFLRYVVEQTLLGHADELKERTIGVNVFGKALTYDTSMDHVVRTAASELRKRLNLYYSQEAHRDELRILLVPGTYVPRICPAPSQEREPSLPEATEPANLLPAEAPEFFALSSTPDPAIRTAASTEPTFVTEPPRSTMSARRPLFLFCGALAMLVCVCWLAFLWTHPSPSAGVQFWQPLLQANGPVLIAVGDVPQGPPVSSPEAETSPAPSMSGIGPPRIPFADATAAARITSMLGAAGKAFTLRREDASSFADLREGPVVLIGAFNNGWSLRLSRGLRFSLAMDAVQHVIYIRDRDHPDSRVWQWSIAPHPGERARDQSRPLHDYALVSRVLNSETGSDVIILGGLYTYGTQAAGEFITDPQMTSLPVGTPLGRGQRRVQVVLETQVTDGSAGPPKVVAVSTE
ncbi:MAG: hypothetical protein ACRYFU_26405 [Janthinobacterium lividum]